MVFSKQIIPDDVKMEYEMKGWVNGYEFTIEGEGNGKPYEGKQTANFKVITGAPLPFSFDLLSPALQYGNRCFTKYPEGMPDYFKQAFPAGMSYERTFTFEDGGVATASGHISLVGNCFKHKSIFHGVNFPADGPVMKKETTGWDPSFEKMTVCNGSLKGDVTMFLLLKNGGYHRCHFNTTYKTKEPVSLPPNHCVEHRIVRTDLDREGNLVKLEEDAAAHVNPLQDHGNVLKIRVPENTLKVL
ncbi:GFP-like fluorescent chromoprotein amFP486 [Pocillopora verrucosa]|uniref:GFP-like fluorescent chromoprotein amFP486 n=1 Tax=Pocillopora verrucosa TaxID=203993 RepID=UPI002796E9C3|nr:GFP-like fluorescent chromoprotein amFP486 [Pocillopora verrucosa]